MNYFLGRMRIDKRKSDVVKNTRELSELSFRK